MSRSLTAVYKIKIDNIDENQGFQTLPSDGTIKEHILSYISLVVVPPWTSAGAPLLVWIVLV